VAVPAYAVRNRGVKLTVAGRYGRDYGYVVSNGQAVGNCRQKPLNAALVGTVIGR